MDQELEPIVVFVFLQVCLLTSKSTEQESLELVILALEQQLDSQMADAVLAFHTRSLVLLDHTVVHSLLVPYCSLVGKMSHMVDQVRVTALALLTLEQHSLLFKDFKPDPSSFSC